ncbi:MAG: glycosyltransferase family 4 protein, partial [Anaerolineae bacterium]|nr:glycosyltransferase family 4 protein [Anaerolineae bacterium]
TMRMRALPMAQALTARGHEVEIFLAPWGNPEDSGREEERGGVKVHNITLPASIPLLGHLIITWRLLLRALKSKPHIIHCFKPKAYSGLVAMAIWFLRSVGLAHVGLVIDSDDWEGRGGWNEIENYTWWQKRFFAFQEKWGLLHCEAVTVASRALQTLAWSLGVKPGNVFYVPNGMPLENLELENALQPAPGPTRLGPAPKERPTVLLYTRFFEFSLERVVEIWKGVVEAIPEARLLVVGKGLFGEEERLRQLMAEREIKGVEYAGWVEEHEIQKRLISADLAIYPYDDTLINRTKCSIKLVELMASRLPIVASDVGENRHYIEHLVSGYLIEPGDDGSFCQAIIHILRDEKLQRALGEEARRRVREKFNWATLVQAVEEAYSIVLQKGTTPPHEDHHSRLSKE